MTTLPFLIMIATTLGAPAIVAAQTESQATSETEPAESETAQTDSATGIYCKLTSGELRDRLADLRDDFVSAIVEVDELDTGYRYWFEKTPDRLEKLAAFVDFESRCCPFLDFEIGLASEAERVSLSLTGRDGTKDYLGALTEKVLAEEE